MGDVQLVSPPGDGITGMRYLTENRLVVSSWDGAVRVYDTEGNALAGKYEEGGPALLGLAVDRSRSVVYTGGLAQEVVARELDSGARRVLGSHDKPVRCVETVDSVPHLVFSGGWDGMVRGWDEREPPGKAALEWAQESKVVAMSANAGGLVVCASIARRVLAVDVRQTAAPLSVRDSPLKHQTRTVLAFPDGSGYAIGSIEGRIAVETLRPEGLHFAFKCHRGPDPAGTEVAYPVNALSYHPRYESFVSGGSDGYVCVWDPRHKKRLCQFSRYATSIAALAFSPAATQLAVAASYVFEEGPRDHPPDAIFIRTPVDAEVRPR